MVRRIPAVSIEHLNRMLDGEVAAIKKMDKLTLESKALLIMYVESFQQRINTSAFDALNRQTGEGNE